MSQSDARSSFRRAVGQGEHDERFHCPACSYGPRPAEDVLVHVVTNHEVRS